MATERQRSHPSGQVVSVRLPPDLIRRLDTLSERTGRSRGTYLRMAVRSSGREAVTNYRVIERYRRQAEERYRRLDDVLRAMPDDPPPPEGKPS